MTVNTGAQLRVEPKNQVIFDKSTVKAEDNTLHLVDKVARLQLLPQIAWSWLCWSGMKTFDGMDFVGEVLANFLGLTQSKYQWIIDTQAREEQERRQRRLSNRQRRQLCLEQLLEVELSKLEELEVGAREQDSAHMATPFAMQ